VWRPSPPAEALAGGFRRRIRPRATRCSAPRSRSRGRTSRLAGARPATSGGCSSRRSARRSSRGCPRSLRRRPVDRREFPKRLLVGVALCAAQFRVRYRIGGFHDPLHRRGDRRSLYPFPDGVRGFERCAVSGAVVRRCTARLPTRPPGRRPPRRPPGRLPEPHRLQRRLDGGDVGRFDGQFRLRPPRRCRVPAGACRHPGSVSPGRVCRLPFPDGSTLGARGRSRGRPAERRRGRRTLLRVASVYSCPRGRNGRSCHSCSDAWRPSA